MKSTPLSIGLNIVLPGFGYIYRARPLQGAFAFALFCWASLNPGLVGIDTPASAALAWAVANVVMALDMLILAEQERDGR